MPQIEALQINVAVLLPALAMVGFAMLIMLADILASDSNTSVMPPRGLAWRGVAVSIFLCWWLWGQPAETFQGMAVSDHFALEGAEPDHLGCYRIGYYPQRQLHSADHQADW